MTTPLPVRRAHALDAQAPEHRWLIEGLWATEAVGIVGGGRSDRVRREATYAGPGPSRRSLNWEPMVRSSQCKLL